MALKDRKMRKQGTVGKRKHITLLSTVYDMEQHKGQLWLLMALSGGVKGHFQHQILKEP
jgi:hypothetical protein